MPQQKASDIDLFLQALTSGNAQLAGGILESKARAGAFPPSVLQMAAKSVGLVQNNGAWSFQANNSVPSINQGQQPPTQTPTNPPIRPPKTIMPLGR